ncbi:MAG: DUF1330 domain-containing protein [Chloroflexi bacterium]|nr:DUF1330 domain-containing protein [Chloroflexota bacterium]
MSSQPVEVTSLLWLKAGVTADQARNYFTRLLAPIVRRHGGEPLADGYPLFVEATVRGELKPDVIDGFRFPSQEAMEALFQDPAYQEIVPIRDATFDMTRQSVFRVSRAAPTA